MKILKSIAIMALAGVLLVSCKKNSEEGEKIIPQIEVKAPKVKKEIAPENLQAATFKIEGMTCAIGCAKTIQEELSDLDGVQSAEVDFDKKLATVTFDKTIQNQSSLTQIVQATGDGSTYKVSDFH
ncbi:heavy metal-associated domain-containing protein [Flavobacterium sp. NG2]|uniref:heavy-metal-associated domain-containing protein n=1 Tax=Flavobacterium sp. NG2 TaxID=3097547 RepID=UPI002A8155C0|nr:heavy metal-associated domain-containing protein [Flavobacterium sp. NG2]WPR72006.1 heavy metal-associated domain-containing protein [Flavobacterium sp. NG2]